MLPKMVFDFVDGGADKEATLKRNILGFHEITFRPNPLVDVSNLSLSCKVYAEDLTFPVLPGPAGLARLVRREGELAAARAAERAGTIFVALTREHTP